MSDEFTPINEIEKIVQNDKSNNKSNNDKSNNITESIFNVVGIDINLKQLVWLIIVFLIVVNPYTVNFLLTKISFLQKSNSTNSFDGIMSASDMKYVANNNEVNSNLSLLLVQSGLFGALVVVMNALLQLNYI